MRFAIWLSIGAYDNFGIGLRFDWAGGYDHNLEILIGPLHIWGAQGWGWTIRILGKDVFDSPK